MFLPGRRSNNASRAPSLHARSSKEDLRFVPSAIAIPALGRRLDLDDDDSDDLLWADRPTTSDDDDADDAPLRMRNSRPGMGPRTQTFSSQRSTSAPGADSNLATPTSERSSMFGPDVDVQTLRVSQIQKGTTAKDLASAFGLGQGPIGVEQLAITQIKVEWRPDGSALLHFISGDEAMRAYFAYLGSNLSVGTVTPYDPDNANSSSASSSPRNAAILNSSPALAPPTQLNKTTSTGRLKSLGSWRASTDKLQPVDRNAVPSLSINTTTGAQSPVLDGSAAPADASKSKSKTHKFRTPSKSNISLGRRSTDVLPLSGSTSATSGTATEPAPPLPPLPRHVSAPAQSPPPKLSTYTNGNATATIAQANGSSNLSGANTTTDKHQSVGRARRFMSSIGSRFKSSDSVHTHTSPDKPR